MDYRDRELGSVLKGYLKEMPVVVITGMRQTGKTTLLLNEPSLRERRYINLDDFAQLEAAKRDPEVLLTGSDPVTIDEVQRIPELLRVVKRLVDKDQSPGRFILSGSANLSLLKGVSESLAGRAIYLNLRPFTFRETTERIKDKPFLVNFIQSQTVPSKEFPPFDLEMVLKGGMPPVCLGRVSKPTVWFRGYEQTYLERDVRDLVRVTDLTSFRRVIRLLAYRSGSILKISELARDTGLNVNTVSRYIGVLEASFIVDRLPPYLAGKVARLIKSPKIVLGDSGIASFLTGTEKVHQEPFFGAMLETYVAQNLLAILEIYLPQATLHFWHVQGRHEVDFVIEVDGKALAIEVKATSRWSEKDLKGLKAFIRKVPHCQGAILAYTGTHAVSLGNKMWAIPLGMLLS